MSGPDTFVRLQADLQTEATQVLQTLDLLESLTLAGRPVQIGSSVLGLMTWRDIDVHVYCHPLLPERCYESLRPVAVHPWTMRLTFSNRQGALRRSNEPEGYYAGIRCITDAREEWKIDVWFVQSEAPHPELEMMERMKTLLTPETRLAILRLKSVWHDSPAYRDTVTSVDIYDAVLTHGVRTEVEFDSYLRVWRHT